MKTEVKLDGNYYKLMRLPSQTLANQMASKVGQGTSEYGDLTTWSGWIQEDWQEGVGKLKPHRGGGYLYGEAESRAPGQLILPQYMNVVQTALPAAATGFYSPYAIKRTALVGAGGHVRVGTVTQLNGAEDVIRFYFYASIPVGVNVTVRLYTNSGLLPTTQLASATYTPPEGNTGWYWHGVSLPATAVTNGPYVNYTFAVEPTAATDSFEWAIGDSSTPTPVGTGSFFDGSTWATFTPANETPLFLINSYALTTSPAFVGTGSGFFRFNNKLYAYANNRVYVLGVTGFWGSVGAITGVAGVTGATVFDTYVYFGNSGGDGNYTIMSTAEVFTHTTFKGTIFAKFKGQLWRAYQNFAEYSEDGVVWQPTAEFGEAIFATDTSDSITGMCGMGEIMYLSTTAGLVPVHPGDHVVGGRTWGSLHPQNGMRMVEFEGSLYMTVNGRVVRYSEDGSMQDVWMTRDDDVLVGRIGKVWDLEKVNNWLFALVEATVVGGKPTIWAYQNNSWHPIATLPPSNSPQSGLVVDYDVFYDRLTNKLWSITPDQLTYSWYIPDYALNPYNDPASRYMRTAWIEWDWFNGTILEADKDFESVTLIGENFSSGCYIDVYWKDDQSVDWEYLARGDSDFAELRWTGVPYLTRPNSKKIKLGLLLVSDDSSKTPRLRAIRVKYHLMVKDWFRWSLQLDVSGRSEAMQMSADGKRNLVGAQRLKDNLDALVKQVPPFIYQDVDGTEYEVKVTDSNFTYTKWEYNESTEVSWWEGVYNMTLEQVTQEAYTP